MKPNVNYYVTKINEVVKQTEEIGEKMHPHYEEIREAIDQNKTAELTAEKLQEVANTFQEGTDQYVTLLSEITQLKAPVKSMGIHKKLEKAYQEYVEGCQEMIASLKDTVDAAAFDAAEEKQDEATDAITFCIQRMTKIILGR